MIENFFCRESINYSRTIKNNNMIINESKKMSNLYVEEIKKRIEAAEKNKTRICITFALSRMGIIYFYEDGGSIDVSFPKDYCIEPIEEEYKREAIAYILSENIVTNVKMVYSEIRNHSLKCEKDSSFAGWIHISLIFDIEFFNI